VSEKRLKNHKKEISQQFKKDLKSCHAFKAGS